MLVWLNTFCKMAQLVSLNVMLATMELFQIQHKEEFAIHVMSIIVKIAVIKHQHVVNVPQITI